MNILIVLYNDNATGGGAEGVLKQIAEEYLKRGENVHVLFMKPRKCGHWEGMGFNNLHLYYGGGVSFICKICKLRTNSFDYSYSSLVKLTGLIGLLKRLKLLRIKTMVGRESTSIFARYHGLRLRYYQLWYWLGYTAVDVLICQTELMKNQLLKHQPWLEKKSKVVVIPNPVNVEQMMIKAQEPLDVSSYTPYIVTAGRFIPEKAYDVLLDAFYEIKKTYKDLKIVFLGDGSLRAQMDEQIQRLQLSEYVIMAGHVENVYPWFKQARLCVVSSRIEGFPNVLLQMMSQNENVVSTLCAGGVEDINGLVTCQPNDAIALAKAMVISLSKKGFSNRLLFDEELNSRTINKFIDKVESI